MKTVKGIITALITPMFDSEEINAVQLRIQIRRQLDAGIHGLFVLGTTGEGYILKEHEKEVVIKTAVEEINGRVPLYVGTGCIGTKDTVSLSQKAQMWGADFLSIICPYFATASQNEIYEHYKTIAGEVDIPIIIYNIPARTGVNISPATISKLSGFKNIVGVKDSSGNFDNILQYIEQTPDDFAVLSGNDSLILWTLLAGGAGGITGIANIFPERMVSIYSYFLSGQADNAKKMQDSIRSIRNCLQCGNPNSVVKKAVNLLGYPVGPSRMPFNELSSEGIEALKQVLSDKTMLDIL